MQLDREFIDQLDWGEAIESTIPARGEFFPSRLEASAAVDATDELVQAIRSRMEAGRVLGAPEVVYVPRRTIGSRPAFDVAFIERVVLAALAKRVIDALAPLEQHFHFALHLDAPDEESHRDFERLPLEDEDAKAVVIADVAAFYEYVDHDVLAREIIELSGENELATAIGSALSELVGRGFGLPQGPRGSDVLADLYLTRVDRQLTRRGRTAFRHNDEFRMPLTSPTESRRALVQLETELREVGLVLNAAKTREATRGVYEKWIEAADHRLERARGSAIETARERSELFYGFDPEAFFDASWEDLPVEEVEDAFVSAVTSSPDDDPAGVQDQAITDCLPALARSHSLAALEYLRPLVRERPWLIRSVSLYLRALAGTEHEEDMVRRVSRLLTSRVYILPWVRGWLLDPLLRCNEELPSGTMRHVKSCLLADRAPWFLRGRAALLCALEGQLPEQETMARLIDEAPRATQADLVAAVALARSNWSTGLVGAVAVDDPLLRRVPNLVLEGDFRGVI